MYTASNLEVEFCKALKRSYQKYDKAKPDDGGHACDERDEYYVLSILGLLTTAAAVLDMMFASPLLNFVLIPT